MFTSSHWTSLAKSEGRVGLLARLNRHTILLTVALPMALLVAAACEPGDPGRSTGAYLIEIFDDMHYNPSFKIGEGPRVLPPEDSIPVSGASLPVGNKEQERDRTNPLPQNAETVEYGALLYSRDCAMCHGDLAGGDGYVGLRFAEYSGIQPPAFDSQRVQALTPGEAFSSITNGFGLMPAFGGLLTEEERWAITTIIDAPAAQREAALNAAQDLAQEERALRLLELGDQ